MKNFYVTSPIYYVNDIPHIGHAYTSLACDVLARFHRLESHQVRFLTGTDEHGQKVEKSASNANLTPQEFTDKLSERFRHLSVAMGLSNDDFIRTTEPRHIEAVKNFWNKLKANGHIYESTYAGWYAVRDEAFYNEDEIVDGKAPTGATVEWVEEPSYFFNLSKWQDKLLEFYDKNPDFIQPTSRRNEVISFVKSGLEDLSISRTSFSWGIKVPGDDKHVIYVWLDALTNYISALGYPDLDNKLYKQFWPANVHIVGKDILRFHAVYWPAFLMAANLEPPRKIFAHGWWTNEGQKISKSLGNVIDPLKLVEEFGLDQVRYFLLREVPFGNDGNFACSNLINRINAELANNIGNLIQRVLNMVYKNCEQKVPDYTLSGTNSIEALYQEEHLLQQAEVLLNVIRRPFANLEFHLVLESIVNLATAANIYIDQQTPWSLAKTDVNKMYRVLYVLAETIRYIGIALQPFVPESADLILSQLGISTDQRLFSYLNKSYALKIGSSIMQPSPIFRRIVNE
jgi:methionyl-tRNA synthetase